MTSDKIFLVKAGVWKDEHYQKSIKVELTPAEIELLKSALCKEPTLRNLTEWLEMGIENYTTNLKKIFPNSNLSEKGEGTLMFMRELKNLLPQLLKQYTTIEEQSLLKKLEGLK